MTAMVKTDEALDIRFLARALVTQILRRSVAMLYARAPWLLRLHRPIIDRGRYRLRFSPCRFAILLYRYPSLRRHDEQFLTHYLKPGMTYVDVGANIGTTTLAAADAVGADGTVIAFEPHPRTFRDLADNVALNHALVQRISLIAAAVGDSMGKARITNLPENDVNHIDEAGIPVRITTLDEALAATHHIDLLKIDVEGYEKNVLLGAGETLDKTGAIYFENCEENFVQFGYSGDDVFDLLEASGFSCFAVDPVDFRLTQVAKGHRCVQGYENLLALRCGRDPGKEWALQSEAVSC